MFSTLAWRLGCGRRLGDVRGLLVGHLRLGLGLDSFGSWSRQSVRASRTSSCALDRWELDPSNLSRPACLLRRDRCKTKWQLAGLLVSYRTLARCLRPHWSSSPAPAAKQLRGVLGAKTRQVPKVLQAVALPELRVERGAALGSRRPTCLFCSSTRGSGPNYSTSCLLVAARQQKQS